VNDDFILIILRRDFLRRDAGKFVTAGQATIAARAVPG
jgi:hypothetical protein